jgi:hypothetical protein
MSANDRAAKTAPTGSGRGGRVEIADIRAKLEEIQGDTEEVTAKAKPYALMGGAGFVLLLVVVAFLLGRGRGKRKATWVEIRRL